MFEIDGYTFKEIKTKNVKNLFKVKCLQTGDERESSISYDEAAQLLIAQYNFGKEIKENQSKDAEYVRKVFSEVLLGRKKSECDNLVREQIVNKSRVLGTIVSFTTDLLEPYKKYQTNNFNVNILFENGFNRKSTKVIVEKREDIV